MIAYATGNRPINWTTAESLEALAADGNYPIEFDRDYAVVTTREGTEYRARLAAVGERVAS